MLFVHNTAPFSSVSAHDTCAFNPQTLTCLSLTACCTFTLWQTEKGSCQLSASLNFRQIWAWLLSPQWNCCCSSIYIQSKFVGGENTTETMMCKSLFCFTRAGRWCKRNIWITSLVTPANQGSCSQPARTEIGLMDTTKWTASLTLGSARATRAAESISQKLFIYVRESDKLQAMMSLPIARGWNEMIFRVSYVILWQLTAWKPQFQPELFFWL